MNDRNRHLNDREVRAPAGDLGGRSATSVAGPRFQYTLNRLPIGIVTLDGERRVVSYSRAAASTLGEERLRETLGKSIHGAHSSSSSDKIELLLRRARDEGASGFASMTINMPEKLLQLRVVQLLDGAGEAGFCLMVYDVTELTSHPDPDAATAADAPRRLFKLPITTAGRVALMDVDQVSVLEAQGHGTEVRAAGQRFQCGLSLSELEERLPPERFMRVHRSFIVNLARASGVRRRDERVVLAMEDDPTAEVPVSRQYAPRLRKLLGM